MLSQKQSVSISASDRHVRSSVTLMPLLDLSQVFTHSAFQEQDRLFPPASTYCHWGCGELEWKEQKCIFLCERCLYLLIFFICYMPVSIKPLTPLALVNTIATLHPSQHFPVGWIGSLTNHPPQGSTRRAWKAAHQPRSPQVSVPAVGGQVGAQWPPLTKRGRRQALASSLPQVLVAVPSILPH